MAPAAVRSPRHGRGLVFCDREVCVRRILLIGSVLLLISCSAPGRPAADASNATALDDRPEATPTTGPLVIPTPAQNSGVVIGEIYSLLAEAPLAGQAIYLGERVPLNPGPGYLVTIQQEGSPHVTADAHGRFVFADVPPGDYPLLVWTPFNSYVIPNLKGDRELSVVVEAG